MMYYPYSDDWRPPNLFPHPKRAETLKRSKNDLACRTISEQSREYEVARFIFITICGILYVERVVYPSKSHYLRIPPTPPKTLRRRSLQLATRPIKLFNKAITTKGFVRYMSASIWFVALAPSLFFRHDFFWLPNLALALAIVSDGANDAMRWQVHLYPIVDVRRLQSDDTAKIFGSIFVPKTRNSTKDIRILFQ